MVKNLKLSLLAMAMVAGGTASAQQLPNANFDGEWVNCYPWEKGAKVKNTRGTQPDGWCMANVNGMGGLGATVVGAKGADRSGEEGKSSVTITNTPNPLSAQQVVPGYMSLGTTWATAKATMAGVVTAGTADGGVFGGIALTKRPDALSFYYKRAHNVNSTTKSPTNLTEKASIIAYAWKGTWTQVEVPSNTAMTNPTKVTMTDRSNNILGKDCLTGGAVTKTADAELISQIEYYIEEDQEDWKQVTIPFEYKNETAIPEKFNVIFSANDIFADRAGIGAGNQLCIDDVELVYYHSLTALSYDGKAIEGFAEDTYEYSLENEDYDATKELAYTKTGIASTVETSYDEEAALLSICVKGDDGEETVYTIQFAKAASGPQVVDSKTYSEELYVSVDGNTSDSQIANVVVETLDNGNINFTLKNFVLASEEGGMPVGNISLKNVEVNSDGTFAFNGGINIEAGDDENYGEEEWLGPMLAEMGEIPLDLTGEFEDDHVRVIIDIDMSETLGQIINVHLGYDRVDMAPKHAYATFCAPFTIGLPEGVKAYTCSSIDSKSNLVLEECESPVPGGCPVILETEIEQNSKVIEPYFNEDMEMYRAKKYSFFGVKRKNALATYGLLRGVYEETTAPIGSYVLQNQEGKTAFYRVEDEIIVPANHAYLVVPLDAKALGFTTAATAINAVNALVSGKAEVYGANGARQNGLQKGMNIVKMADGSVQKVLVK